MSLRLFSALLPLTLLAACAGTPDTPPSALGAAAKPSKFARAAAEGKKMTCRRERVVGTNMPRRICFTNYERDELAEKARDDLIRRSGGVLGNNRDGGAVGNTAPGS